MKDGPNSTNRKLFTSLLSDLFLQNFHTISDIYSKFLTAVELIQKNLIIRIQVSMGNVSFLSYVQCTTVKVEVTLVIESMFQ